MYYYFWSACCLFILHNTLLMHGFLGDTLVFTNEQSWTQIIDLQIGQRLGNFNDTQLTISDKQLLPATFAVGIYLSNQETVFTCAEQPFLCVTQSLNENPQFFWCSASELKPDMQIMALGHQDGMLNVERLEIIDLKNQPCTMVCLTVLPDHIFYVTKSLLVVHNQERGAPQATGVSLPLIACGLPTAIGLGLAAAAPFIAVGLLIFYRGWAQEQAETERQKRLLLLQEQAHQAEQAKLQQSVWGETPKSVPPNLPVNPSPATKPETATGPKIGWPIMPPLEKGPFVGIGIEEKFDEANNRWIRIITESEQHQTLTESAWSVFDPQGLWIKSVADDGTILALADPEKNQLQKSIKDRLNNLANTTKKPNFSNEAQELHNSDLNKSINSEYSESTRIEIIKLQQQVQFLRESIQGESLKSKTLCVCLSILGLYIVDFHPIIKILHIVFASFYSEIFDLLKETYFSVSQKLNTASQNLKNQWDNKKIALFAFINSQGNLWSKQQGSCIDYGIEWKEQLKC